MVAAKTAADNGAKVVIVEKCEEGKAGGNTKVWDADGNDIYYQATSTSSCPWD